MKARVLLVDDDPQALDSTRKILERAGYSVESVSDGEQALERVRPGGASVPDLIVTDVRMPRLSGMELLKALSVCRKEVPVILMTAFGRVEDAVWAMKLGAVDFLTKPFKRQALLSAVEAALTRARARGNASREEEGEPGASKPRGLVGISQAMQNLRGLVDQVAPTEATVLLSGESGSGKELVARTLHERSARSGKPFVALNCAAIPEQLIESELFGHEKGAFSGAQGARPGLFEEADGGTLLLDEIGDMPLALQAKLLRALQEGEVRRLGATRPVRVDVRVISATHRDLRAAVREGAFREDLLFRLEVVTVRVPPLRERVEDILDLSYQFLQDAARRHGKEVTGIDDEAVEVLLAHEWPGNVRELSNVIERAVVFATGPQITPAELPSHLVSMAERKPLQETGAAKMAAARSISVPLGTPLREVEEMLIRKTLEATAGDKNMTARLLGVNSRTIYRKLEKKPAH